MAKQRRVHEIAKELGVDSKAIIAKCHAEGIADIVTHMSPVKVGLELSIKEWFNSAEAAGHSAAVETAAPVDMAKARKPARRKSALTATVTGDSDQHHESNTAVAEPPAEHVKPQAKAPAAPSPAAAHPAPAETDAPAAAAETHGPSRLIAGQAPAAAPASPHAPAPVHSPGVAHARPRPVIVPAGKPNVPDRPTNVQRVGQALDKPGSVTLRGPKVIRVDKPDNLEAPRPRRAPGAGPSGSGFGGPRPAPRTGTPAGAPGSDSGITRSRGPVRGRGAGAVPQAPPDEGPNSKGALKRRSQSNRRGRSADALPSGPTRLTEQDIIELDNRLSRATGFLKQRRRTLKKDQQPGQAALSPAEIGGKVEIAEPVTIKSLSSVIGVKSVDIIKYLLAKKGVMATINSAIANEVAMEVALEYDIELVVKEEQTAEQIVVAEFDQRTEIDVRPRPPVVTVMGHVDHGKTSLLDRIRKADVAAHEAGGITQHVGAYRVTVKGNDGKDKTVVFLDTPGHEAFTTMRSRGAGLTDMVVLVVAADDGVMPQTIESINHAKAAEVPIIVALNKIDKPEATEANIRKIYGQLAEHGLNPTEWGGTTEVMKVSATKGTGITELLEVLDYQAELLELKADYGGTARGTVIESQMQPGRGSVARVLVEQGWIKLGDFVVIGRAFGRVRDMTDDRNKSIKEAGPSTPLELSGINQIPDAGDKFYVTDTLNKAEEIAVHYREVERNRQLASQTKVTLDNLASQLAAGNVKELRVVLKADVQGSIDVLKKSLTDLSNQEVVVKVLHAAVGGVTESDVLLADASDAIIIGFHVIATTAVRDIAEQRGVDIRLYRIIYECIDEVKKALEGMLEPEKKEEAIGQAEVREVFNISKLGKIAGCLVTDGMIQRTGKVRVIRDGAIVTDNRSIESLRRIKQDVNEVRSGTECGIRIVGFDDLKPGDKIACYSVLTIKRTLASAAK